ncbi:MAG: hypothetical protein V4722_09245 [Bacteroidota bacterium]
MTQKEREEIEKQIDSASMDGVENAVSKMQQRTKCANFKQLVNPISSIRHSLNSYKVRLNSKMNVDGMFEEILADVNSIYQKFIEIDDNEENIIPAPIYIFTTTASSISSTLSPDIYTLLKTPPPRYKEDHAEWFPFSKTPESINRIMDELKKVGCQFHLTYISEILDEEKRDNFIAEIALNISQVVAIVDVLAINDSNEEIAQVFSNVNVKRVMIPFDSRLDISVQDYIELIRDRTYRTLRNARVQRERGYDIYDSAIIDKDTMVNILKRILPKKNMQAQLPGEASNPELKSLAPNM